MFGSRWGAVFTLGLVAGGGLAILAIVWIIGLNYCPNQPCYYSQAADDPDRYTGKRVWQMPDAVRGTFSYETEPEYAPGNPTRHEYYDLRAQERMAHATDWIAWLTFVTGAVGLTGLGALVYTLNLQRDANKIMRHEQRPWMKANFAFDEILIEDDGVTVIASFRHENVGQKPAMAVRVHAVELDLDDATQASNAAFLRRIKDETDGAPIKSGVVFPGEFATGLKVYLCPLPEHRNVQTWLMTAARYSTGPDTNDGLTITTSRVVISVREGVSCFGDAKSADDIHVIMYPTEIGYAG